MDGRVRVEALPVSEPGAPNQPAAKRLLLEKGELAQFYTSPEPIRTIAYCELREGKVRGNHYHHRRLEHMYVIRGACRLVLEDVAGKGRDEAILGAGDLAIIPPGIAHAIEPLAHGDAIEFSPMEFDPADTLPYAVL